MVPHRWFRVLLLLLLGYAMDFCHANDPLSPLGPHTGNSTVRYGYTQGIGITMTNIGNINLAAGTFQASFLLYSKIAKTVKPFAVDGGSDSDNYCPLNADAMWYSWQGSIQTSFDGTPVKDDPNYGFQMVNGILRIPFFLSLKIIYFTTPPPNPSLPRGDPFTKITPRRQILNLES